MGIIIRQNMSENYYYIFTPTDVQSVGN